MLLEPLWRSYMRHAGWPALTILEHVARINQSIWGFNPAIHVRSCFQAHLNNRLFSIYLKVVFAKNKRGYRLNATTERFWMLLILLLSVASIRRKLLKTSHDEYLSVHTNWENCNIRLRPQKNQYKVYTNVAKDSRWL